MAGAGLENIWPEPNCDSNRDAAASILLVTRILSSGARGFEFGRRDLQHSYACDLPGLLRPEFSGASRSACGRIHLLGPRRLFQREKCGQANGSGGTGVLAPVVLALLWCPCSRKTAPYFFW